MSSGKYCEMKINFNDLSDVSYEDGYGDHDHFMSNRQLAALTPAVMAETGSFSRFMPSDDGWIVEEVPRRDGSRVDKYYYELRTGRKFRSPQEIKRYINGEAVRSEHSKHSKYIKHGGKRSRSSKYIMRGGKAIKLDEEECNENQLSIVKFNATAGLPNTDLPDGWIIENVPRRSRSLKRGSSYKQYYEPGTGRKFRSLIEVQRHLDEDIPLSTYIEDINENAHLSAFNMYHKEKDVSRKIKLTGSSDGNDMTSSFPRRCKEVKWILGSSSSGGDVWYPFSIEIPVPGSVKWVPVPGSVKEQWNQRFMAVMNGYKSKHLSTNMC